MDWITLAEMAERLGLRDTAPLRRLCEAGELVCVKKGKTWLVDPGEIEAYRARRLGQRGRPRKENA